MPTPDRLFHPIDVAAYAGRWIALVRDRVAGVGLTPQAAKQLAKASRPKDEPLVVFVAKLFDDRAIK